MTMYKSLMGDSDENQFSQSDRALIVVGDETIRGSTRLQKYGFLLHKQYEKEMSRIAAKMQVLEFYNDWEPLWYWPFSRGLSEDVQTCVDSRLIYKEPSGLPDSYRYGLTIPGLVKWREMLREFDDEMTAIHKGVMNLQKVRLERLLEGMYNAYPEFTGRSTIKNRF